MQPTVLTVKQLNSYVKSIIEGDYRLSSLYLKGEISNFKNHYQSGHLYFSLKDKDAVIKAVMFRSSAQYLKFEPKDGMSVICRGRVSLYERDGSYQFYADEMIPEGIGDLAVAFEQIKEKLDALGYFDISHKKPIPKYPKKICVITSETGAAVRDILNILERRYPVCEVILIPALVQGESAPDDLVRALNTVQGLDDIDTVIIGRGGGSIEDLWAFNNEKLAKAIFDCKIPVISAVGHETDFTICDFVSDLRAPTPSAAAELAVPDINELKLNIDSLFERTLFLYKNLLMHKYSSLSSLIQGSVLSNGERLVLNTVHRLERAETALINVYNKTIESNKFKFKERVAKLNVLSPLNILSRGYSVATKGQNVINSTDALEVGDTINVKFSDGDATCNVIGLNER